MYNIIMYHNGTTMYATCDCITEVIGKAWAFTSFSTRFHMVVNGKKVF